jgi:hypothetical protein
MATIIVNPIRRITVMLKCQPMPIVFVAPVQIHCDHQRKVSPHLWSFRQGDDADIFVKCSSQIGG